MDTSDVTWENSSESYLERLSIDSVYCECGGHVFDGRLVCIDCHKELNGTLSISKEGVFTFHMEVKTNGH